METDKSTRRKAPGVPNQGPSASGVQKGGPQEGSEGEEAPQSPWPSPKELEEAVGECVGGDCGKVRAIIGMARLRDYGTFMLMRAGVAALLESRGLPRRRISQVAAVTNGYVLKHLIELNEVLKFRLVSEFKPRSVFDAYWQFTSLVTLRLPFIIKSRFDPISEDVCYAFEKEELCHRFVDGFLIAEATKSTDKPSRRFKEVDTTNPASVVTMLGIANHLAKHGIKTKAYINGKQRQVYFIFADLPKDIERFVEDILRNPTSIAELADEEFLAFLSGLLAGDGSIKWRSGGGVEAALAGNLEKEKPLYAVVQGELGRRFGVKATLYERKNAVELHTWYNDTVKLLYLIPPVIEPLKELKRHVVLNKGRLGTYLTGELFRLLGDGRNEEKGIHGLQSYQAIRFLTVLLRLRLIRLKEVEGRAYHILETPTNPRGRSPSGSPRRTAHPPAPARVRAGS